MTGLLIALILAGSPSPDVQSIPAAQFVSNIESQVEAGTLLVSAGDCLAIKTFTGSPHTHVAMVVQRDGRSFVYDSTSGRGVRCQTLANYLGWLGTHEVLILNPETPLSEARVAALTRHLDGELGRPYAVLHHLTGERCEGVHCAEYLTDAFVAADLLKVRSAPKVSPASLVEGVTRCSLYTEAGRFQKIEPVVAPANTGSWCRDCWAETKSCTAWCWSKAKGLVLCQ
jgi:hypothetical protein